MVATATAILQSIAIGIEELDDSKTARTNFVRLVQSNCTTGVFAGRDPFPIAGWYKLIDKSIQSLYWLGFAIAVTVTFDSDSC